MSQSAIKKLQMLPDCFTDKVFMRLSGLPGPSAKVALSRMRHANLIKSAGDRTGIYFNLLKNANSASENATKALLTVYPSAVLCGETVLHNAGWITQIPPAVTVAVLARRSYQKVDGFSIKGMPLNWFKSIAGGILNQEEAEFSTHGLKSLRPEMALLELFKSGDTIDEDDLDIPEDKTDIVNQLFRDCNLSLTPSGIKTRTI